MEIKDPFGNVMQELLERDKTKEPELKLTKLKRDLNICIHEFEKFYDLLMKEAPEWYIPWFFPCEPCGKDPSSEAILKINSTSKGSWHHQSARLNKAQCIDLIKRGYNIGISARTGDPLILIDVDKSEYLNQLPTNTLTVTSRKRDGAHAFGWDKDGTAKINLPTGFGEVRSDNQYLLSCGSYVPFDLSKTKDYEAWDKLSNESKNDALLGYYTLKDAYVPRAISFSDLPEFFQEKERENIEAETKIKQREEKKEYSQGGKYSELFNLKVGDIVGLIPSNKRVGHPLHESDTDANFSLNSDGTLAHCWRHMVSLNAVQYLCVKAGYASCEDAGTPHKGRGLSKIRGDKKAIEAAYNEAVAIGVIKPEEKKSLFENTISKKDVIIPHLGKLISEFCREVTEILKDKNMLFYRPDSKEIIEIGKIKIHNDSEYRYSGFVTIKPSRFVTILENYCVPVMPCYSSQIRQTYYKEKSISAELANTILCSDILQQALPKIIRLFTLPIPIIYEGELTFPKKGFDERFNSWLPFDAPEISQPDMEIEEAKKIIDNILKEFCFLSSQDKTNAISALLSPFLRGLYKTMNTRTPVFFYIGNRERCGKDYLAGITGIIYEGHALEESPISTGDKNKSNNNDELRKKILASMINGRKRLHFANNKGYINNATFEAITTAEKYADRILGRNEILMFENELDFSLSGNTGVGFTPDFANRCRFISLFLDIEDANARKFEKPNLHHWILENRSLIISAFYALVRNWISKGKPSGSLPFTSFHEWATICGGIMEAAGYDNPCMPDKEVLSVGGDSETNEMKQLFELCYQKFPNTWITKKQIKEIIQPTFCEDFEAPQCFGYLDFNNKSDQTIFGNKLIKYIGRILSNIRLKVDNTNTKTSRMRFCFENININSLYHLSTLSTLSTSAPPKGEMKSDCI